MKRTCWSPRPSSKMAWTFPRANTILINRADRLGLAELYQLRGRVGRSNQRAYAYLLVPPETAALRNRAQAPFRDERVQRTGRRLSHRRARPGTSRRRQHAGPPAARPHRSDRLRYVLPDAGARRLQTEGRRIRAGAAHHAEPRPRRAHPGELHPQRESPPAHLQAHFFDRKPRRKSRTSRRNWTDRFGAAACHR